MPDPEAAPPRPLRRVLKRTAIAAVLLLLGVLGLVAILLAWPAPDPPDRSVSGDFVIRDVSVVDVETGTVRPGRDVMLRAGTIESISATGTGPVPQGAVEIDGRGRFLVPGLWDMHTHSNAFAPQFQHPLFIAHGVTAVREMWGCMSRPDPFFACAEDRQRWNRALAEGRGVHPRYVGQSSFQINGGSEVPEGYEAFFRASTPAEARAMAAWYAEHGVDTLKVYSELSPAAYAALAGAAREHGMSVAGHRPVRVSLEQVIDAGQRSIEHGRLFAFECFEDAEAFRARERPMAAYDGDLRRRLVDEQDPARCSALMQRMAASDTAWTPTLLTLRMEGFADDADFRKDAGLRYVPWLVRRLMWFPDADRMAASAVGNDGRNVRRELYRLAQRHVVQANDAGVDILVGTDAMDTYSVPGAGLHDELEALVEAGLTNAEVLRAATLGAAEYSGAADRLGTVASGRTADLLLLDANPLEDIGHTREIAGVFLAGRYFDRDALDALLAFSEARAGSPSQNLKIFFAAIRSPLLRVQMAD
ncbi:amidohydrolase family protein [Halomonas denitrificans]|nr:amidohydrolase family protein [Halomonas denitrificans]